MARVLTTLKSHFFLKKKREQHQNLKTGFYSVLNQFLTSVEEKTEKTKKKKELDYAFTNEKLIQLKKDFPFWITKTNKVFTIYTLMSMNEKSGPKNQLL